jgi:hypothetical protein
VTALSKVKRSNKPPRLVLLKPDAFEVNWPHRPNVDVAIGLRLLSVREEAECRLEAEREAAGVYEEHPNGAPPMMEVLVEQYNEILLCESMARATCNPNDVTKPYFDNAVITVRVALTSVGLRKLWDEYILLAVGTGVVTAPATDEDLQLLGRALRSGAARRLDVESRKLCAYLLENLAGAIPDREGIEEADDDNDDGFLDDDAGDGYTATTGG